MTSFQSQINNASENAILNSEDCPDGSIERQRPNRAVRLAEKRTFPRSAKVISVRLKSRPKFQTDRPITQHDPGNIVPRSAKLQRSTPHRARPKRASRETRPRGRATRSAYHGRCIRPSRERTSHVRPRTIGQISSADHAGRPRIRPTPTVPTRHDPIVRPIVPTDRPNAAVDPKPFLKPKLMFSSPA
ncbi:unnamed protein product [Microthlaspi erraticum]|uniref:Uncharacterized protein n=1 Tax=Microthlaspi erraticum TaxID=1685480 RepID=A0A6D2JPD3_9BRAS|nr:unnamed protein product [Microthlaspi erraticum]